MMRRIFRKLRSVAHLLQIVCGFISTFFLTRFGVDYLEEKAFKGWFLFTGLIFLAMQFLLLYWPRINLKNEKRNLINNLLASCQELLFKEMDKEKWSVCGMIQVPKGRVRRTPYYCNPAVNGAIHTHRRIDFGDVGHAFFSGTVKNQFFSKRFNKHSWENSSNEYKELVPANLRAIIAAAIYSPDEADAARIIGVLEFDIFSRTGNDDLDDTNFVEIDAIENKETLCKWANSVAMLMEEI